MTTFTTEDRIAACGGNCNQGRDECNCQDQSKKVIKKTWADKVAITTIAIAIVILLSVIRLGVSMKGFS